MDVYPASQKVLISGRQKSGEEGRMIRKIQGNARGFLFLPLFCKKHLNCQLQKNKNTYIKLAVFQQSGKKGEIA